MSADQQAHAIARAQAAHTAKRAGSPDDIRAAFLNLRTDHRQSDQTAPPATDTTGDRR